ncbi:hypothetical protein A2893_00225 [Candidatus Woesebacteria bacterium RIFCSPLOWO2_01_FULL_39_25]|uniref:DUF5615 domain-containing protein n=1 Tax=Candidatus Woesebacteria bacterium RIFCSPLOWO2_01_FULL_39_25 TaxID=1802521 RepID=A0A1F8BIN6_9BACT|nr:MAG: hypothetical protein A2893_00225 [Candidatus Woesebacteria bacterium RIFCSPLOWO2_01_FULL_39_25]
MRKTTTSLKFILDANLSPITSEFLRNLGFDTTSIIEEKLYYLSDEEVVKEAKNEGRMIVTFDQDFADLWYFREKGKLGIVRIRTKNQTPEHVNEILKKFFDDPKSSVDLNGRLVVIRETGFRIVS